MSHHILNRNTTAIFFAIPQIETTLDVPVNGKMINIIFKTNVVHTFHSILDHFIQPFIDGIIHVVPFQDLTPFIFP